MGGRGARSGTSKRGNRYGGQYRTLHQSGNIKFVKKNARQSETLMETMTAGRVYAVVGGDEVKSIMYFDKDGKKARQIDLDHTHKGKAPHVHRGYEHQERDPRGRRIDLSEKERRMVDRVLRTWDNRKRSK